MSVPPPNCTRISSSTGSATSSVRSTTEVSNATRWVRSPGRFHRQAAVTAEWITELTIEPDWSTSSTSCHCSRVRRVRVWKYGRSISRRRCSGW